MSGSPPGPRVSAVIPTYQRAELVVRAIRSVLAQSRPPHEIVVVDDGSRDDTPARVAAFGAAVRYVRQENAGGAGARNRGVSEATGEWIAFLDSDDEWLPDHVERMIAAIAATGGAARFYFADTVRTPAEGGARLWDLAGLRVDGPHELRADASDWVMMRRQPMMLQSSVFRRDAYLTAGGLDAALTRRHDTHLFLRLGLGGPACAVAGVGARMTSDDAPGGRLIDAHDSRSTVYWRCSADLYEDVARRVPATSRAHRRELWDRASTAHWRMARLAAARREPRAVVTELARSARDSPCAFADRLAVWGRRRLMRARA